LIRDEKHFLVVYDYIRKNHLVLGEQNDVTQASSILPLSIRDNDRFRAKMGKIIPQ